MARKPSDDLGDLAPVVTESAAEAPVVELALTVPDVGANEADNYARASAGSEE